MTEPKRRVLLVDDEVALVKIVGKLLELAGFDVLTATDGADGLSQAQTQRPDVVITDLMLPKLNGFDLCAALKKDSRTQRAPVIIFTARGRGDEARCRELGASAYFSKTEPTATLIATIKALLGDAASPKP